MTQCSTLPCRAWLLALAVLIPFLTPQAVPAQDSKDFAVQLRAFVTGAPSPAITLRWVADPYAKGYTIWRKARTDADWPAAPLGTADSNATSFVDRDVAVGVGYEYQVIKECQHVLSPTSTLVYDGIGYIFAGVARAPEELPGRVLLLVDSSMAGPLAAELNVLKNDLQAEGWDVVTETVPRAPGFDSAKVQATKRIVMNAYGNARGWLKAVFLIGRVAVPYSGNINPDGHPDHLGAWPADLYYGDIDGRWTDAGVIDTVASREANRNRLRDGKFDPSQIPSDIELAVGRVDFYDMPAFAKTETELLRAYLTRDHKFRSGQMAVKAGGVVDDNFSAASYQEAFASAGWRNMPVFGGDTAVFAGDFFGSLGGATTHQWAYGCGGGSYNSAGGIGGTADFAAKPVHAVFTMLFGSYFGDWDVQNSFLRAPLAAEGDALTCAWVARPQWYFHHMALGETIGYSTRLSQNNGTTYIPNVYFTAQYPNGLLYTVGNRYTHVALLGDPTLRAAMTHIPSPGPLTIVPDTTGETRWVSITWSLPPSPVDGFFVYRRTDRDPVFRLLNLVPLTVPAFTDTTVGYDTATYVVRSAKLMTSASGTYYAGGAVAVADVRVAGVEQQAAITGTMHAVPNPARAATTISFGLPGAGLCTIDVHDTRGAHVASLARQAFAAGENRVMWDMHDDAGRTVPPGVYFVRLATTTSSQMLKLVVLE